MLYKKQKHNNVIWAIWRVDESVEELRDMLGYSLEDGNKKRLQEKLAVRVLLKNLLGHNIEVLYKESGKPYLNNGYSISISHTKGYVAISLSKTRDTGIDIETISDKVTRIRGRFISEKEWIDPANELIHLHIHWAAKETLFKIVDIETSSLKDDFVLDHFPPLQSGSFSITDSRNEQSFEGQYIIDSDFVLTVI